MHQFLSDEWLAAAAEVRARYADRRPAVSVAVRINLAIRDVPFGDDGMVAAHIDTTDGVFVFDLGSLPTADTTVTTDYEVAKALALGAEPAALMQAFLDGRVLVQGDMTRLLVLQAQFPTDDVAREVAEALRAITR